MIKKPSTLNDNTVTSSAKTPTTIFDGGFLASAKVLIGQDGAGIWLTSVFDGQKCLYVRPVSDKTRMLKWDGRIGVTRYAAFFDFDAVPGGLTDRFNVSQSMDMDGFEAYLKHHYPGECIFRTASGNVKMMFIFEGCTKREATEELAEMFPELWPHVDQQGLWHTLVPFDAVDMLNAYIKHGHVRKGFDVDTPEWQLKHNDCIDSLVAKQTGPAKKKLLRFVLSIRCAGPYVYLPISKMAEVCGVSTSTAKLFIDKAIENGDIVCTSKDYCPGSFSRRYKIVNATWLDAMGIDPFKGTEDLGVCMEAFCDGNWFRALWSHTRLFETGVEFMLFVHSIKDAYKPGKGRIAKARAAWRGHARRNGLSPEVM